MKNLFLIGLVIVIFTACEKPEQRYFAESAETKTLEAGIAAYESGDWDKWKSHFADTAKIYVNAYEGRFNAIVQDTRQDRGNGKHGTG